MKPTLQKISLSEGELVNCRVMLTRPQDMTTKLQDIFHIRAMKRMIHSYMMIRGALPLGSPEEAQTILYREVSLVLDDVEANQAEAAASHRFPYPNWACRKIPSERGSTHVTPASPRLPRSLRGLDRLARRRWTERWPWQV